MTVVYDYIRDQSIFLNLFKLLLPNWHIENLLFSGAPEVPAPAPVAAEEPKPEQPKPEQAKPDKKKKEKPAAATAEKKAAAEEEAVHVGR